MRNSATRTPAWKVSLHGGHSGQFCEHAVGTLREILEAAIAAGYHTFGVSEHAPRLESRFLHSSELEKGWDVALLESNFQAYPSELQVLVEEFEDRIQILRGFEAEVVPSDRYKQIMLGYRQQFHFEYMVGSVHYVGDFMLDGSAQEFELAMESQGGLEALAAEYYEAVGRMVDDLRPEVVGHLDLIRKNGRSYGPLDTPAIYRAAERTLEAVRAHQCILDLNTAGIRKGLGCPYPVPELVHMADRMGIGFCFGDDSHRPADVGAGIEEARSYLLQNGVGSITVLTRQEGEIVRRVVEL
ncbi:MAG: histidinol-phosphatase [Acidobacteriota bacterium]